MTFTILTIPFSCFHAIRYQFLYKNSLSCTKSIILTHFSALEIKSKLYCRHFILFSVEGQWTEWTAVQVLANCQPSLRAKRFFIVHIGHFRDLFLYLTFGKPISTLFNGERFSFRMSYITSFIDFIYCKKHFGIWNGESQYGNLGNMTEIKRKKLPLRNGSAAISLNLGY